jgi:hypothetical protein
MISFYEILAVRCDSWMSLNETNQIDWETEILSGAIESFFIQK